MIIVCLCSLTVSTPYPLLTLTKVCKMIIFATNIVRFFFYVIELWWFLHLQSSLKLPFNACVCCFLLSRWNKWDGQWLRRGHRGVRGASCQAGEVGARGNPGDPGRGTRRWVPPCGGCCPAWCTSLFAAAPTGPHWAHPYPLCWYSDHPPLQHHRQHLCLCLRVWGHSRPCLASFCPVTLHISFSL